MRNRQGKRLLTIILLILRQDYFVTSFSTTTIATKPPRTLSTDLLATSTNDITAPSSSSSSSSSFQLDSALFCAGLAFDAYVEPPANSTRWERGSKGMSVAFVSQAFTRSLYQGLLEIKLHQITDLPNDDDGAEALLTGGGVDAYLLVAAIEGPWKEDVQLLEQEAYHDGVLGLIGAAHVGRSRTAWANINEQSSKQKLKKTGQAIPYHIKSTWGKGGQAIYTNDEPPFYLYIQDPAKVRLAFTVMDDDIVGEGDPIGSAHKKLTDLIPTAALTGNNLIQHLKANVIERYKRGEIENLDDLQPTDLDLDFNAVWDGEIKLTSKPRIKDKKGNMALGVAAGAVVAGPIGAAAGAFLSQMYEGQVRGRIHLKIRYLPIPQIDVPRQKYVVRSHNESYHFPTQNN